MKIKIIIALKVFGILTVAYAGILAAGFFGVKFGITNTKGAIDEKSYEYEKAIVQFQQKPLVVQDKAERDGEMDLYACEVEVVRDFAPINAEKIQSNRILTKNKILTAKMLLAVKIRLMENPDFQSRLEKCRVAAEKGESTGLQVTKSLKGEKNVFPWMNTDEWEVIKGAVVKDKEAIEKASKIAGIEPRLLVSNLIVEQVRLFHSQRELFEKFFEPLKILGNANKISLGVMGIKEATAIKIENNLKDRNSDYYLGAEFENILDLQGKDAPAQRYQKLTNENHFYNYLYGALYIKQFLNQWEKAGFDIKYRPEILGTLYNVGFPQSKPKPDPKVGGSSINVEGVKYSFGSLSYEFYYSGELMDEFPYIF